MENKINVKDEVVKTKEVFYRGKPIEELKSLGVREIAKYMPSRSRRTLLRKFDVVEKFIQQCDKKIFMKKKIRTHLRDIVIVPRLVGYSIHVYNGKNFQEVKISPLMIGHRLGEFVLTRRKVIHGNPGMGATKGSAAEKK